MKRILILLGIILSYKYLFGEICVNQLYYEIISDNEVRFTKFDDGLMNDEHQVGLLDIPPYIEYQGHTYTVSELGDRCFRKQGLKEIFDVSIPHTIKCIGNDIFGDINITCLWFSADYPFPATAGQFSKRGADGVYREEEPCNVGFIYVPEGTIDRYRSAPGFRSLANPQLLNLNYDEYPGLIAQKGPYQFREADNWVILPVDTSDTADVRETVLCYHIDRWRNPDHLPPVWSGFIHLTVPAALTVDGTEYVIREIADEAFYMTTDELSVDVPPTVTKLGAGAFADSNIEEVTGMENVSGMGNACFANSSLLRLKFPENVNAVPDRCFASTNSSQNIERIEFHENVRSFGEEIFYRCTVCTMICRNPEPVPVPIANDGSLFGPECTFGTLYVPAQSVELYKNAEGWSRFTEILPID